MENNSVFTNQGTGIAKLLRNFCAKISNPDKSFEKMYYNEESLITYLEHRIEEAEDPKITPRLYSINADLNEKIRDLKFTVEGTKKAIMTLENSRDLVENALMAEIKKIGENLENSDIKPDHKRIAKSYLRNAKEIEQSLHKSAEFLMQLKNMLIDYNNRLALLSIQVPHERSKTVQRMRRILDTAKLFQSEFRREMTGITFECVL